MRVPRVYIVHQNDFIHMIWKCHNDSPLLRKKDVKDKILQLYLRYKTEHKIKIYSFNILDNHCHFLMQAPNAQVLGEFTRTVHSQVSKFINKTLNRNSQAIKDRYKSPPIRNLKYMARLIGYIWLNKYKSNRQSDPTRDKYCSLYQRLHKTYISKFLSPLSDLGIDHRADTSAKFLRKMIQCYLKDFEGPASNRSMIQKLTNNILVGTSDQIQACRKRLNEKKRKRILKPAPS